MMPHPYLGPRPLTEPGQLRTWLSSLSHAELVDWVWHTAVRDRILGECLRCEAAQDAVGGLDPSALRESIERLTQIHGGITWRESAVAGEQVEAALDLLRRAIDRAPSPALEGIWQFAQHRAEQAIMDAQESESWSNAVLTQLEDLHRRIAAGSSELSAEFTAQLAASRMTSLRASGNDPA